MCLRKPGSSGAAGAGAAGRPGEAGAGTTLVATSLVGCKHLALAACTNHTSPRAPRSPNQITQTPPQPSAGASGRDDTVIVNRSSLLKAAVANAAAQEGGPARDPSLPKPRRMGEQGQWVRSEPGSCCCRGLGWPFAAWTGWATDPTAHSVIVCILMRTAHRQEGGSGEEHACLPYLPTCSCCKVLADVSNTATPLGAGMLGLGRALRVTPGSAPPAAPEPAGAGAAAGATGPPGGSEDAEATHRKRKAEAEAAHSPKPPAAAGNFKRRSPCSEVGSGRGRREELWRQPQAVAAD